jgi:hypothetical protein
MDNHEKQITNYMRYLEHKHRELRRHYSRNIHPRAYRYRVANSRGSILRAPNSIATNSRTIKPINSKSLIPTDLLREILKYGMEKEFVLQPWVDKKQIDRRNYFKNPKAIKDIISNVDKIKDKDWQYLAENPKIFDLLKLHPTKIGKHPSFPSRIARSPEMIGVIKTNLSRISWYDLSQNPHPDAIEILKKNPNKIDWDQLASNPSTLAMKLLEPNLYRLAHHGWDNLSGNPRAISLLRKNPSRINWFILCGVATKEAIDFISGNLGNLNFHHWNRLMSNPAAVPLLHKHIDKIIENRQLMTICGNPNAASLVKKLLDYPEMNHPLTNYKCWVTISGNPGPGFTEIIWNNPTKVKLKALAANRNPNIFPVFKFLFEKSEDYTVKSDIWSRISANPSMEKLIVANLDKIDWVELSANPVIFKSRSDVIKEIC